MSGQMASEIPMRHACPDVGRIQTGYFRGLKSFISRLGDRCESVFEPYRLNPIAFEEFDYHMDSQTAASMLEDLSVRFDDVSFGLHLAERQDPDSFGTITALARAAPTFERALQCFVDFLPVLNSPEGRNQLVVSGETSEFRWHSTADVSQQANQHGLTLFVKTLRMLGGADFRPSYVCLRAALSARQRRTLEDHIGCSVRRLDRNGIGFPTAALQLELPSRNGYLYQMLKVRLDQLKAGTDCSFSASVEAFIARSMSTGACRIEHCAAEMNLPLRTLQRRLADEGRNFSDLVERQRMIKAKESLRHTKVALADLALELGYFDQTSFCRAFKRWTGVSPREFRRACLN